MTNGNYEHYKDEEASTKGNYENNKGKDADTNVKAAGEAGAARCARRPFVLLRPGRRGAENAAGAGSGGERCGLGGRSVALRGRSVAKGRDVGEP